MVFFELLLSALLYTPSRFGEHQRCEGSRQGHNVHASFFFNKNTPKKTQKKTGLCPAKLEKFLTYSFGNQRKGLWPPMKFLASDLQCFWPIIVACATFKLMFSLLKVKVLLLMANY
jgi:hypothetical protein